MPTSVRERSRLRNLIRTFSISFRLWPASGSVANTNREATCEIELKGQHYSTGGHVNGGCPRCIEVLLVLLELHDRILSERRSSAYRRPQCEKLIRYVSTAGDWPEVALDVKIIRRLALGCDSDNWAARLTDEVRGELLDLGCREMPFVFTAATPVVADWQFGLAGRAV